MAKGNVFYCRYEGENTCKSPEQRESRLNKASGMGLARRRDGGWEVSERWRQEREKTAEILGL